jgi:hypothetical protein
VAVQRVPKEGVHRALNKEPKKGKLRLAPCTRPTDELSSWGSGVFPGMKPHMWDASGT